MLTQLQEKVLAEVKFRLKDEEWFTEVDMYKFPEDEEIYNKGIVLSVSSVVRNTSLYYNPNHFGDKF